MDDPEEIVNYAGAHDNHTFWDVSQFKHPAGTTSDIRTRAQNVGLDVIMLSQGVPFFASGQDIMSSKSDDTDSFDFGDWFNTLDCT